MDRPVQIWDHTRLQSYPTNFGKIGYPTLRRPACGGFSKVAYMVGEIRSLRHMRANSITGNTTEICGDTVRVTADISGKASIFATMHRTQKASLWWV